MLETKSKELVHTFIPDRFNYIRSRRSGNTTRQIDLAIQLLFEGKIVQCKDHYLITEDRHIVDNTTRRELAKDMLKRIIRRLSIEHNINTDNLIIDKKNFTIELKD